MNWEDERYVRLYTRDTGDWSALSWDAQALFMQLLRKADRAGVLQLGKRGRSALPFMLCHPTEADRIDAALSELLDDGCVELRGSFLVIPNFTAAQEAKQSDRMRQQESRQRRLAHARQEPVSEATTVSHAVTRGHAASPHVTPSVPSVLSHAVPEIPRTHTRPQEQDPLSPAPAQEPASDDNVAAAWLAIERGAGGPEGVGLKRNYGQSQPLWLDDNRALLWCRNWGELRKAKPPPTLADAEKLGRWLAAGGAGEIKTPWQMLAKGGAAPNIGAWLDQSDRWDGISDPRPQRGAPRAPANAPMAVPREYPESLAKRQADAIERGELPVVDDAVVQEQLRKLREMRGEAE